MLLTTGQLHSLYLLFGFFPDGSNSTENSIGGEPPIEVDLPAVDVVLPDVSEATSSHLKRRADAPTGETPEPKTIVLDMPPPEDFESLALGHSVAELHDVLGKAGLKIGLDVERMPDGWHGPLPDGSHAHVASFTSSTPAGHRLSEVSFPSVTTLVQSEPGLGWQIYELAHNRHWASATLDNMQYRVLSVYHPCGHAVCSVRREPEVEYSLADSDAEDDPAEKSAKNVMKLVPRKMRKALDREIPWDLIPEHQRPLFEEAMRKEWSEWKSWNAVQILTPQQSAAVWRDPVKRRYIIPSRFAFRNKHAAEDPAELQRRGLELISPKARLCIQGFRQVDKHKLRKDSPTLSRCGFFCVLQTCLDYEFHFFGGDAKSAFMQGGSDPGGEELYLSQPRNGSLPGMLKGQICRLIGSAYGKVNAPRLWWRVLVGYLVPVDWQRHSMDQSVLMKYDGDRLVGVVGIHVDDLLGGCISADVIQPLRERFKWGSFTFDGAEFTFCGRLIEVRQRSLKVSMRAHNVAIEINKMPRHRRGSPQSPLTGGEPAELISGIGTLQWVGSNVNPPIQACVSMAQGGQPTVETLMAVQSMLKEVRDNPDEGVILVRVDRSVAIIASFGDGSWANVGNRTQAGYVTYITTADALSETGGVCSMVDWRSHRLKRACHCTLYAEAMASRAAATSATWTRNFFLEVAIRSHRAALSVDDSHESVVSGMLLIHIVTDCNSLHETVVKSRLPEDKRAAIEVIAIREMITDAGYSSDSEIEDSGRLKERDLASVYHWTVSEDQRADILTKKSLIADRREWLAVNNFFSLRSAKRTDEKLKKHIPSRPRMGIDRGLASLVMSQKDVAARAAGYDVPAANDSNEAHAVASTLTRVPRCSRVQAKRLKKS